LSPGFEPRSHLAGLGGPYLGLIRHFLRSTSLCLFSFSSRTLCHSDNRVAKTVFVMRLRNPSPMMTHEQGLVAVRRVQLGLVPVAVQPVRAAPTPTGESPRRARRLASGPLAGGTGCAGLIKGVSRFFSKIFHAPRSTKRAAYRVPSRARLGVRAGVKGNVDPLHQISPNPCIPCRPSSLTGGMVFRRASQSSR